MVLEVPVMSPGRLPCRPVLVLLHLKHPDTCCQRNQRILIGERGRFLHIDHKAWQNLYIYTGTQAKCRGRK
jgi:hypothetical protein